MRSAIKIKIGSFSILLSAILCFAAPGRFLALFLAVTLHELGHLLGAYLCKIPMREFRLGIFGAGLTPQSAILSYKKEILLCAFGPLINFISIPLAAYILPPQLYASAFWTDFRLSSLSLGALNLLPIEGFDGGRIFLSLLLIKLYPGAATSILRAISVTLIFLLWSLSVYMLLRVSSSLPLFVFSSYLFAKIFIKETI